MQQIDIEAVLRGKAPKIARWIPRWAVEWLRRTIHEEEMNRFLAQADGLAPQPFLKAFFRELDIRYTVEGLEALDPAGRYLFVSNHPFGGMDGMMLADKLIDRFGDVRVVVNDLLMHVEPLAPLWVPVNKHGNQNAAYARRFEEALQSDLPMLTFPAGLCSRRHGGVVADLPWKSSFIKQARQSGRTIVPLFVEGTLSDRFYRLANFRTGLGLKFNIEMLFLVDEMFRQRGRTFRIRCGAPVSQDELDAAGNRRAQADAVRIKTYFLQK